MVFSVDWLAAGTPSPAGGSTIGRRAHARHFRTRNAELAAATAGRPRFWKINWSRLFALVFAPLLSGVLWWLILGTFVDAMGVRRADLPEPAPAGWAQLGLKPGYSVLTVRTAAESDALCRAGGVSASDQFNKRLIVACVIPGRRQVILPDVAADDPVKMRALEDHEFPHTWGLVHKPSGREWLNPDGSSAKPLGQSQARMMRAMANASVLPNQVSDLPMAGTSWTPTLAVVPNAPGARAAALMGIGARNRTGVGIL